MIPLEGRPAWIVRALAGIPRLRVSHVGERRCQYCHSYFKPKLQRGGSRQAYCSLVCRSRACWNRRYHRRALERKVYG